MSTIWVIEIFLGSVGKWTTFGGITRAYDTWQEADRNLKQSRREHPELVLRRAAYRRTAVAGEHVRRSEVPNCALVHDGAL